MKVLVRFIAFIIVIAFIAIYAIGKMPKDLKIIPRSNIVANEIIKPGLKAGSTGEDVRILQIVLGTDEDIYPSGIVSGYFGNLTREAVINFQVRYSLNKTGIVDEATAKKLNGIFGTKTRDYYVALVPTPEVVELRINQPVNDNEEWGKAKQIGEYTWTMKIGFDPAMATPQEIFDALNNYRRLHGKNTLYWDDRLANYALSRARYFTQIGNLDSHAGFSEFVKSEDNVRSLGFWGLGENSSYGYRLNGTHLIEWVFAGDKPHDDNQLSSDWTHVGIGVDGNQVDLIFGGQQI